MLKETLGDSRLLLIACDANRDVVEGRWGPAGGDPPYTTGVARIRRV